MTSLQLLPSARIQARRPCIRIFNVKFSPNLGDGLLSECLEQALVDCGADPDTCSVDLAARTDYTPGSGRRSLQMQVLGALPGTVRRLAVQAPLAVRSRTRWAPHYAQSLHRAECIVIGGGNLIADLDLNFPTKIALAVEEASRRDLPVFIYGCGASAGWSRRGRALLEGAVRRRVIRKVWVRDERSRSIWDELIGRSAGLEAGLVRDPGLLALERYGIVRRHAIGRAPVIGLNLTSPLAVRYHSHSAPSAAALDRWYLEFAASLLLKGHSLAIFSNGSPEDRACVSRLRPRFEALDPGGRVSFPVADTPAELAALIAGCEAIAAFRMHAIIAAYSCGVPFLALSWDPKLDSFLRSVNLPDRLCTPVATTAPDAAHRLGRAIAQGLCPDERLKVVAEARLGITDLYDEIVRELA